MRVLQISRHACNRPHGPVPSVELSPYIARRFRCSWPSPLMTTVPATPFDALAIGRRVIQLEAEQLQQLAAALDAHFARAIELLLATRGRVVVSGMGKSGIIGQKIAATLASTGTTSFFLHPAEAYHGDLGMISPDDLCLALSNSGETEEVVRLLSFLQDNGNPLIALTGNPQSTLARHATVHLTVRVTQEACPLQLAPTASTTAALALGDALAMALMEARQFRPEQFARFHPGGSLGRRLLLRVHHMMKRDHLPTVTPTSPVSAVIAAISAGRLGLAVVLDSEAALAGVITDGDLRRALEKYPHQFSQLTAADVMSRHPQTIDLNARIEAAREQMHAKNITALLVIDQGQFVGVVHLHDCA